MTCTSKPNSPSPSSAPRHTRSWRRTITDALALAQSAVELDSNDTDPMGALVAYTESVRHLRRILARLERHGAHTEASHLAAITAGYSERMRLLCVVCAVPPPPYDCSSSESSHHSLSLSPPPGLTAAAATALPPPPAYDECTLEPTRRPKTAVAM